MRFRLIDHIVEYSPWEKITALKSVSFEEYSLKDKFGCEPSLPETLLIEAMLQAGNWLITLSSNFTKLGFILSIKEIIVHRSLLPGETASFKLRVVSKHEDSILMEGEGTVNGEEIVVGRGCIAVFSELSTFEDPEDLKVLYEEIGPEPPGY
ncbi:hypothetical protein ACFL35_16620 [Candidatus Riflebacteria bacterium]